MDQVGRVQSKLGEFSIRGLLKSSVGCIQWILSILIIKTSPFRLKAPPIGLFDIKTPLLSRFFKKNSPFEADSQSTLGLFYALF